MRLPTFIAAAAVLAVALPANAQDESTAEEKDIVRGSEEVEEQRKLTTEKEETETAAGPEQPASEDDDDYEEPERDEADFGHMMQVGIRGGFVFGYGMSFRYDNSPFCKEPDTSPQDGDVPSEQQSICGFGKAPATEIALSFAPLDSIEPYLWARLAFSDESATDTEPTQAFGVGLRIYTMSDSPFKIFVEPAIGYEIEGAAGNTQYCSDGCPDILDGQPATGVDDYVTDYKQDIMFHIGIGPQYDFAKYVGVFLNGGLDVGILRSISAAFIGNVGLQVRVP